MSFFSEWLADIAEIHAKNDYKLTIVSTGFYRWTPGRDSL